MPNVSRKLSKFFLGRSFVIFIGFLRLHVSMLNSRMLVYRTLVQCDSERGESSLARLDRGRIPASGERLRLGRIEPHRHAEDDPASLLSAFLSYDSL